MEDIACISFRVRALIALTGAPLPAAFGWVSRSARLQMFSGFLASCYYLQQAAQTASPRDVPLLRLLDLRKELVGKFALLARQARIEQGQRYLIHRIVAVALGGVSLREINAISADACLGLPRKADNDAKWSIMKPLLENPALKPGASDIAAAEASALDLLRIREEVGLLRLGSADLIKQKVSFPNSGPGATPGVIVMLIDDLVGDDVDRRLEGALVVFNASPDATTQTLPELAGRGFALTAAQANGSDAVVKTTTWDAATGALTVPARSVAVLVDKEDVRTAVIAAPDKVVAKHSAMVKVVGKVVAADGTAPVGTVTVTDGGKVIATAQLTAADKGKVAVALPKLGKGVHLIRTSFEGSAGFADSRTLVPVPVLIH